MASNKEKVGDKFDNLLQTNKEEKVKPKAAKAAKGEHGVASENLRSRINNAPSIADDPREIRVTYLMRTDLSEKFRSLCHWDGLVQKEIIENILGEYVKNYEAKNGEIPFAPKKITRPKGPKKNPKP